MRDKAISPNASVVSMPPRAGYQIGVDLDLCRSLVVDREPSSGPTT